MRHLPLVIFILICLLAFTLRLYKLDDVPLRGDEAFSAQYWAGTPLDVSLSQIAQGEPHTPLVYAVARAWNHAIGGIESVFALRMLSALGNMLGVAGVYALGKRLTGRRDAGMLAALMWALHPYLIWHSQEFRNYGYWAGMNVVALWLGARLIARDTRTNWLGYALAGGFCALTIYTEPFSTLAITGFAILRRRGDWPFLRRLIALQAVFALLLAVGFLLLAVRTGYAEAYPGLQPAFSPPQYMTVFAPTLTLGSSVPLDMAALGAAVSLWLLVAAAFAFMRFRRAFQLLALAILLPMLGLGIASQRWDLFHPRYVLSASAGAISLLVCGSLGMADWLRRRVRLDARLMTLVLLSPWFMLAAMTLDAHYNNPANRKAPAWDSLGEFLNRRVSEEDLVIQLAGDAAFGYYYRGAARDIGLPLHGGQPVDEVRSALESLAAEHDSIWVAAREQAGWANAGAVDAWLREYWQEVLRADADGMPVKQYLPREVPAGEVVADFGGVVGLLRHTFFADPLPTGEWLLWLDWQPLSKSQTRFKTFVHMYVDGALVSQADQYPQSGALDSTSWRLDAPFRDVYYLPAAGAARNEHEIHVGWYDEATGERLPTGDNDTHRLLTVPLSG